MLRLLGIWWSFKFTIFGNHSNIIRNSGFIFSLNSLQVQVPSNIIPGRVKNAIIYAAEQLKDYNFIFKYEHQPNDGDMFRNLSNLHLKSWVPQKDLLCKNYKNTKWADSSVDGRVSAFVSHMGLNSLLETSQAAVPLVAVPLFADQGHNSRCGN